VLSDTTESVVKRKTAGRGPPLRARRNGACNRAPTVNRLSEPRQGSDTLVPVDPERHALEVRIERAKARIVEDLNRASGLVRGVVVRVGRGLGLLALCAVGLGLVGAALAARAWRRRRIRITWR
jgi:hypothetical protein